MAATPPNNDWQSTTQDPIDDYSAGVDIYLHKKMYITAYYSLSAGKGNVNSEYLGDPTITGTNVAPNPNAFLLTGTNAATPYPETVDRYHEVGIVFKYKLTDRLTPKIEYRYQQWDNRDYQTTVMTPYMGCVSAAPPAAPVRRLHQPHPQQLHLPHSHLRRRQPLLPRLRRRRSLRIALSFPRSGPALLQSKHPDRHPRVPLLNPCSGRLLLAPAGEGGRTRSILAAQMILRVPHPLRFVQRVGSYDQTPQSLRSFFSPQLAATPSWSIASIKSRRPNDLEGAPSFAVCAKGGLLRSNAAIPPLFLLSAARCHTFLVNCLDQISPPE